jgi:hypothetical protein
MRYRYGWCGSKPRYKVHLTRNGRTPLCGIHRSNSWRGFFTVADTAPKGRPHCPTCQRKRTAFDSAAVTRADWSDLSIAAETSELSRVLGLQRDE